MVVLSELLQRLKGLLCPSDGRLGLVATRPSARRQEHLGLARLRVIDFLEAPAVSPCNESVRRRTACLHDLVKCGLEVGVADRGGHKSRRDLRHGGLGNLDEVAVEGEEVADGAGLGVGRVNDLVEQLLDLCGMGACAECLGRVRRSPDCCSRSVTSEKELDRPSWELTIYDLGSLGLVGVGWCAVVSVLKTWSRQLLVLEPLEAGHRRAAVGILREGNPSNAHIGRHLDKVVGGFDFSGKCCCCEGVCVCEES